MKKMFLVTKVVFLLIILLMLIAPKSSNEGIDQKNILFSIGGWLIAILLIIENGVYILKRKLFPAMKIIGILLYSVCTIIVITGLFKLCAITSNIGPSQLNMLPQIGPVMSISWFFMFFVLFLTIFNIIFYLKHKEP